MPRHTFSLFKSRLVTLLVSSSQHRNSIQVVQQLSGYTILSASEEDNARVFNGKKRPIFSRLGFHEDRFQDSGNSLVIETSLRVSM